MLHETQLPSGEIETIVMGPIERISRRTLWDASAGVCRVVINAVGINAVRINAVTRVVLADVSSMCQLPGQLR